MSLAEAHAKMSRPAFKQPPVISAEQLSALIETAFWASLRSNEGRSTRFSLTVADATLVEVSRPFKNSIPYEEFEIARVAPALPPGGSFGLWLSGDNFSIWGFFDRRPGEWLNAVSITSGEPGVLRVGVGPYQPYAVIDGRSNPVLAGFRISLARALDRALRRPRVVDGDIPATQRAWRETLALGDLVREIVAEGHGGTLLVVPDNSEAWKKGLQPLACEFAAPDTRISDAIRAEQDAMGREPEKVAAFLTAAFDAGAVDLARLLRSIAVLAAVDGAVVVTNQLAVLGFGAKITAPSVESVCHLSPLPDEQDVVTRPLESVGGTRHQSAVRYVASNHDAVALVISQDRHFSLVHWMDSIHSVAFVRHAEWWL